jgi:hypothetical protein
MASNWTSLCQSLSRRIGGTAYSRPLDGWTVSWISDDCYRHICVQYEPAAVRNFLVVMQNPGSLSRDGAGLRKDLTLRVLRRVFAGTGVSPIVVNLFDLATTKPAELEDNWSRRDKANSVTIYDLLADVSFEGFLFAYGNYIGNLSERVADVEARIYEIETGLAHLRKFPQVNNSNGTPTHPRIWQTSKLIDEMRAKIQAFCCA